jgi:hypothetical protein
METFIKYIEDIQSYLYQSAIQLIVVYNTYYSITTSHMDMNTQKITMEIVGLVKVSKHVG